MLSIRELSKSFDNYQVLKSLNWDIPDGQILGLIGSNGAGKSTMLRCISGVYEYETGSIILDGHEISAKRDQMFFISDEPFYVSRFTTKEMKNFYRSFYADFDEVDYNRLLGLFHFDEKKPIHMLSKGLKRQCAIILALSCQPRLLLMDESFDGLDPMMRLTLKRELIKRVQEDGISVVISSHNIRELEDICDGMALLEDHGIVFTQTLEELNSNYHKIQLGYKEAPDPAIFAAIPLLHLDVSNKIVTAVYRGDEAKPLLDATEPILTNPLPLSMEEIFVLEMEAKQDEQN